MIYVLAGCKRSGKDTTFHILKTEWESQGYRVAQFAYADALREVCSVVFGYTQSDFMDDDRKESMPSPILGADWTPRRALQYVGTDLFRKQVDGEVWVRVGLARIERLARENDVVVVTDARFENELHAVKSVGRSVCIFIARPSQMPRVCTHESERFVQELEENFVRMRGVVGNDESALFLRNTFFDYVFFNEDLSSLKRTLLETFPKPEAHFFANS
jgi:hypothetical protein